MLVGAQGKAVRPNERLKKSNRSLFYKAQCVRTTNVPGIRDRHTTLIKGWWNGCGRAEEESGIAGGSFAICPFKKEIGGTRPCQSLEKRDLTTVSIESLGRREGRGRQGGGHAGIVRPCD